MMDLVACLHEYEAYRFPKPVLLLCGTLEKAIIETENLNEGEVFLVKDLFKGYVWNRIPRKDRLLLGTLFLNRVNKMDGSLKAIDKTSSNQQRYEKIIK
jgi:hypothetical protein